MSGTDSHEFQIATILPGSAHIRPVTSSGISKAHRRAYPRQAIGMDSLPAGDATVACLYRPSPLHGDI